MAENLIFGSNIDLPSLSGLESNCEEELLLLMKEVDLEFQRKHSELLTELVSVRTLCHAQRNEIEKLRCLLQNNDETAQRDKLEEVTKKYSSDIKKLEKENEELRSENSSLKRRVQSGYELPLDTLKRSLSMQQIDELRSENSSFKRRVQSGYELPLDSLKRSLSMQQIDELRSENSSLKRRGQSGYELPLDSLKRSLSMQQEENKILRERLSKVDEQYQSLQVTYHRLVKGLTTSLDLNNESQNQRQTDAVHSDIVQIVEKFMSEEDKFCNDFLSHINGEIDNLKKKIEEEFCKLE